MKEWGVMDDDSGESMEPMEEVPLVGLGESELERLVRGQIKSKSNMTLIMVDKPQPSYNLLNVMK